MLLQIEVKVVAITVLEDSAERVGINLKYVIQLYNPWVDQRLVNVVFTKSVPVKKIRLRFKNFIF